MLKKITCRGIFLHEGKILVVKHLPENNWYALAGGTFENNETFDECVKREIYEELWVLPEVGNIAYIHEFWDPKKNSYILEFFYIINNPQDFLKIDLSKTSHGFEICELKWIDPESASEILMPEFLKKELSGKTLQDLQQKPIQRFICK